MRKFYLFIAVMAATSGCLGAQNKLNAPTRMLLNDYKVMHEGGINMMSSGSKAMVSVLVRLNHGYSAEDIKLPVGAEVTGIYGPVISVTLPVDAIEKIADNKAVKSVSLSERKSPMMNKARPAGKVDKVQAGDGLEQPFDGKGVVTGLMDTGIDPNHVNFMNLEQTESRVKEVYAFNGTNGVPTVSATTPDEVKSFTTDNKNETHGTHVAGIMAGSYNGIGTYVVGKTTTSNNIPYYGVATGSDIVMTAGNLYDNNILAGVTKVLEYAESQNKPAVVNLSLGSIVGPHDGTSDLSVALAELGKRGIICISAGNDGERACAVNLGQFSKMRPDFRTGLPIFMEETPNTVEFWSDDKEGFDLDFIIYDAQQKKIVTTVTLARDQNGLVQVGGTETSYPHDDNFSAMCSPSSYLRMEGGVDPANDRYYVYISCELTSGSAAYLIPGVKIYNKGVKSGMVYGYTNEGEFSGSITGWTKGTANGSISDMATGANIIPVGAFTSTSNFSFLADPQNSYTYKLTENAICPFSSYGPNVATGEQLPLITAPGSVIISSVNSYDGSYDDSNTSAYAFVNSRANRWAIMQGTSMSCPFMSGVVALWLEADPTLKVDDVIDIATKTATVDSYVNAGPAAQWGAGKVDALAGIKEVLVRKNAGVQGVITDVADELIITPTGDRSWNVSVASASRVTARMYSLQGIQVAAAYANDSQLTLDAAHVAPGVYVLTVETPNTDRLSRRLLVR